MPRAEFKPRMSHSSVSVRRAEVEDWPVFSYRGVHFYIAKDGVASAEGSRWCGRPATIVFCGFGSQCVTHLATTCVSPMKITATTTLKLK